MVAKGYYGLRRLSHTESVQIDVHVRFAHELGCLKGKLRPTFSRTMGEDDRGIALVDIQLGPRLIIGLLGLHKLKPMGYFSVFGPSAPRTISPMRKVHLQSPLKTSTIGASLTSTDDFL